MKLDELDTFVRDPLRPENTGLAARVYADASLWPAFENFLYPDAEPSDGDRETIRRFVSERCGWRQAERLHELLAARRDRLTYGMDDFALAAVRRESGAVGGKQASSAEPVNFVFLSDLQALPDVPAKAWRAELTLPAEAGADEMLAIALSDGDGVSIDGGIFRIAGVALPVSQGRAEIPYGLFLSGLKDAHVEFVDAKGVRTCGALALF